MAGSNASLHAAAPIAAPPLVVVSHSNVDNGAPQNLASKTSQESITDSARTQRPPTTKWFKSRTPQSDRQLCSSPTSNHCEQAAAATRLPLASRARRSSSLIVEVSSYVPNYRRSRRTAQPQPQSTELNLHRGRALRQAPQSRSEPAASASRDACSTRTSTASRGRAGTDTSEGEFETGATPERPRWATSHWDALASATSAIGKWRVAYKRQFFSTHL